jgi:hypothetical protein
MIGKGSTASNGRFCEMAAVTPQTILYKFARYYPEGTLVEAATSQSRWDELYYEEQWEELQQSNLSRDNPPAVINVHPLLKTQWNQNFSNDLLSYCDAYNYFAPNSNGKCSCFPNGGEKCPAGCVAVAIAQIMKYWNYPVYMPNKAKQYDWCNMPDSLIYYGNSNYEKQRNAINHLLEDCANKVDMKFCDGDCGSSSNINKAYNALVNDFGYSKDADHQRRFWWSDEVWKGRIKNNLDQGWPIYYRSPGHAFVCDGYGSDDLFHFNWGWGGDYQDDWFTIDNLTPGDHNYNSNQHAIFYLYPELNYDPNTYCNLTFPLFLHYASGGTHQNVPKTFMRIESAPETSPSAWRTIESRQTVEYVAHEEIRLLPGFHAKAGSYFHAYIDPCESCETGSKSMLFINHDEDPIEKIHSKYNEMFYTEKLLQAKTNTKAITLYPNPNPGTFQLETNFPLSKIGNFKIINLLGATVYETQNLSSNTIQLTNAPAGQYFVVMILKDGTVITQKMMILY